MSGDIHHAGFSDPVLDAQRVFRTAIDALARPGTMHALREDLVETLGALPCAAATAALLLTLADQDTPVHLNLPPEDSQVLQSWLAFHCGAPVTADPGEAMFAVTPVDSFDETALDRYACGVPDYPDRSTTVICEAESVEHGSPSAMDSVTLSGPGIKDRAGLAIVPHSPGFWHGVALNRARFPLGVDLYLTAGASLAGLPRSVSVTDANAPMLEAG